MAVAEKRIHHPCSPSSLQVYEASPCFLPKNEDSEASLAGTLQHDAAESRDFSKLNDEQAEAVQKCCDYVDDLIAKYPGCTVVNEEYLPVDQEQLFEGFVGSTAGYLDVGIVSSDRLEAHVVDFKFGRWGVEPAETNLQGIAYALGLREKFPSLMCINVHFLQPYLDSIDVALFTKSEFSQLYLRVRAVAERRKDWLERSLSADPSQWPEYYPTTSTCIFCARLGACPAAQKMALKVGKKFLPLEVPESVEPALSYDPQKQAQLIKLADVMKLWSESVRRQITDEALRAGEPPAGYKFVQSSRPSIKDAIYVKEQAEALGVPKEVIKEAMSITLTPLEKAISEISPRGHKKANVEAFRESLETAGAVVQGEPFTSLRMVADKPNDE